MTTMTNEELVQYVIKELGKHRHPNDVIQAIAESGAMDWNHAKRFVYGVKAEHAAQINRQSAPLLLIIAVITLLVGAGISVGIVIATLNGIIIYFLRFPVPYLGNIFYFCFGVVAFVGGLTGAMKTMKKAI